jgi:sucrose-6-phosphate hydrolase SacC (GH32 family)
VLLKKKPQKETNVKDAFLFVHFKEKSTPDGEAVYFALSRDGFAWEPVNGGNPVLESTLGDCGVRDLAITRTRDGRFVILGTDLSLARHFAGKYKNSWAEIGRNGSKELALWESDDLVTWSGQRMVTMGDDAFGCVWAPDITFDTNTGGYVVHWSSPHVSNGYGNKKIFYRRTSDFITFSPPEVLYEKADSGVIDSAMYEEGGRYYLFVKSESNPAMIILLRSDAITGPWERVRAFDAELAKLAQGQYEAPTACKTADGRWLLFLDFYGTSNKAEQGYVPFVSGDLSGGVFIRSDSAFSFPYGFKHGSILGITMREYERIQGYRWKNQRKASH